MAELTTCQQMGRRCWQRGRTTTPGAAQAGNAVASATTGLRWRWGAKLGGYMRERKEAPHKEAGIRMICTLAKTWALTPPSRGALVRWKAMGVVEPAKRAAYAAFASEL